MRDRTGIATGARCTERTASARALMRGTSAVLLLGAFATAAAACGTRGDEGSPQRGSVPKAQPSGASATAPVAAGASALGTKPICPATGAWQMCSVIERLERAGLAPRREDDVAREAPLSQAGVMITLGRSELRVFIYADRAARERDQSRLDRTKYVSAADPLSMQAEPTLIASENLLAILRSRSDHQRERVSDALTAGPPQPPGTKG